ncbi:MAG TPA: sigma-70 family RNA polymerase sigma factor [Gaiellaceae bacterium]|nr:sigma-70 family RNA polymerase sigma factor [Gaiellaceae bacterium]HLG09657.1 sigma-70 family RNA polymerase sigma factor [Gaiellaceae bacterium]
MSDLTVSSMHDARDAEDTRLLAAHEVNMLVEGYYESIILRCRVRCRSEDDALDCAQAVAVRLLSELERGRRYSVPYRVVVHKVIEWTTKGFYERGRAILVELDDDVPEEVFHAANPYGDVETRYDLSLALAKLPPGDREVARLRLLHGYEIEGIARHLGKKRNAVDQALHRACTALRETFA